MRTPSNLAYHELIGLPVRVLNHEGGPTTFSGKVIWETKNTLIILSEKGRRLIIPKQRKVFIFKLGDKDVALRGELLAFRPEDRTGRIDP
ncbi:MAG: ribonuclease P protein subunit [Crenarchaeota archaeon]|nr:ribonuclease P protein subunit [Thermoproteota archaeon]MDW8033822.1 ribonuclease P protein subunit [Nitrososphaerota archaeon]